MQSFINKSYVMKLSKGVKIITLFIMVLYGLLFLIMSEQVREKKGSGALPSKMLYKGSFKIFWMVVFSYF